MKTVFLSLGIFCLYGVSFSDISSKFILLICGCVLLQNKSLLPVYLVTVGAMVTGSFSGDFTAVLGRGEHSVGSCYCRRVMAPYVDQVSL